MKLSLPILFAMALLASTRAQDVPPQPESRPDDSGPPGIALIEHTARQLAEQESVQADLRQRIELFGQSLVGSGTYLQKKSPHGLLMRLDWKIPVADRVASIQQVCNGRFLWIRRDFLNDPVLERVDLARVRKTLDRESTQPLMPFGPEYLPIVGLPHMLHNLTEFFEFEAPRAARLGNVDVWVVQGTWNPPDHDSDIDRTATSLPAKPASAPYLPTHIRVIIESQNSMLRRIEYLRRHVREVSETGTNGAADFQTLAVLEVLELSSGGTLDDGLFTFQPGRHEIDDHTDRYLSSLRSAGKRSRQ